MPHGVGWRPPDMREGIAAAAHEARIGEEELAWCVEEGPRLVVDGGAVRPPRLTPARRLRRSPGRGCPGGRDRGAGRAEPRRQRRARPPAPEPFGLGHVEGAASELAGARRRELGLTLVAQAPSSTSSTLTSRPPPTLTTSRGGPLSAARKAVDHVVDEDVVTGLQPVSEHGAGLAGQQPPAEDGHHAGLAVRVLPGPVDVAQAQRHPRRVVQPAVDPQ